MHYEKQPSLTTHNNMKKITQLFKITALALVLSFGLSYVYAWTAPTATPPGGNVTAPINTSITEQYKAGALGVEGVLKAYTQLNTPKICLNSDSDPTTNCITSWPSGGGGAIASVNPLGAGISVSPTTGTVYVSNTGVTKVNGQTGDVTVASGITSITNGGCAPGQVVTSISSAGVATCASAPAGDPLPGTVAGYCAFNGSGLGCWGGGYLSGKAYPVVSCTNESHGSMYGSTLWVTATCAPGWTPNKNTSSDAPWDPGKGISAPNCVNPSYATGLCIKL